MANQNYTIDDVGNYITSMQDGGTILFLLLLGSDDRNSAGQVWTIDDGFNNVTITCLFTNSPPLYLTASSAAEGEYVGSSQTRTENSFWSIGDDGSLQLINNGAPTNLYAVIGADNGLLTLATTAKTKWKFSKTLQTVKGWET
jgi:hypothetical protein